MSLVVVNVKPNVRVQEYTLPDQPFTGFFAWAKLCDQADRGEIPARVQYEVVSHAGNGIWSIDKSTRDRDEAYRIANAIPEAAANKIPVGYAVTSLGDVVLQEDWDEIEGNL